MHITDHGYEINQGVMPPTCFPVGFDQTGLIEISVLEDHWARFYDQKKDKIIKCADFHDQYLRERANANHNYPA